VCAAVFAELKFRGINCEMALEYAKDKVWEGSLNVLDNQLYIFGKQFHRIHRLLGKVDVILTDSPILLSVIYGHRLPEEFLKLVWSQYHALSNLDIFLHRKKPYNPAGRVQTEDKAQEIDKKIWTMLQDTDFFSFDASREQVGEIVLLVEDQLHKLQGGSRGANR